MTATAAFRIASIFDQRIDDGFVLLVATAVFLVAPRWASITSGVRRMMSSRYSSSTLLPAMAASSR